MTSPRSGRILLGFGFLAVCLSLAAGGNAAQNGPPPRDDEAVQLVFFGQTRPVLLRLHITTEGKSVAEHWNSYLQKWFAFLDVNDDGVLDMAEAERAPSAEMFVHLASQSGGFNPIPPPRGKVDRPNFRATEMGVRLPEFQAYYRRTLSPLQVQAQNENGTFHKQVSTTLFTALDADKDGKLSKPEVMNAVSALRKYDLEDTEWITAASLAPTLAELGQRFLIRQAPLEMQGEFKSDSFFHIRPGEARLPMLLLSRYAKGESKMLSREQLGLDADVFARLDSNKDGGLDAEELARWHERPADFEITLPIGKLGGPPVEFHITPRSPLYARALKQNPPGTMLALDDAQINLTAVDTGVMLRPPPPVVPFSVQVFRQIDTKKQGFVTMEDVQQGRGAQILAQIFSFADRDRNGKLTEQELQAFVNLQTSGGDAFGTVSVFDQGRVLFQHLDVNKDDRLSLRELQNAWSRLSSLDANGDGYIEQSEIPRQFQISAAKRQGGVGGGQVVFFSPPRPGPMIRPTSDGRFVPAWFTKMDKNGDGDVSRREFLGSSQDFARIDADSDGLISADEAVRFDPRPPQVRRER